MGEIVGAAVLGHHPTIMLTEEQRVRLGGGRDTTLVAGFGEARRRLDAVGADTLVIFDTHWFTTLEHVIAGQPHHRGVYTSEEVPRAICDFEFDYPGAPALAALVHQVAKERGVPTTNVTTPSFPHQYPTINLVHWLQRDEQVLSIGVCQTAELDDFLELGAVLADAVARSDRRVALLGSGGMSHRFWPLREMRAHTGYSQEHVISAEARAADQRVLELWREGAHAEVIDFVPTFRAFSPEGGFAHYLMLVGALGGRRCRAPGTPMSDYEASFGTGQVHVWFDIDGVSPRSEG
jgi:3,4-dihydroxyphenylacetate 2,3-dioxygenase